MRALLSVWDKTGLLELSQGLDQASFPPAVLRRRWPIGAFPTRKLLK